MEIKKLIFSVCFASVFCIVNAQTNALEFSAQTEKTYSPYMYARHGGPEGLAEFKKNSPHDYLKELWYYAESFYIERNYASDGATLDASIIDIARFEKYRKEDEKFTLLLPGFKDAIILLPVKNLIYKP
jgi:hypothetical protein